MKRRSRIEVNLQELGQIIDRATDAPLSKAEREKLKAALHAMADRPSTKRSTEKTSAVLGESQASASAQPARMHALARRAMAETARLSLLAELLVAIRAATPIS